MRFLLYCQDFSVFELIFYGPFMHAETSLVHTGDETAPFSATIIVASGRGFTVGLHMVGSNDADIAV